MNAVETSVVQDVHGVIPLAGRLIAINSANPRTDAAGAGEREIAGFCADWCRRRSLAVTFSAEPDGRPSIVADSIGAAAGATVLLVGHLDTYAWWQPSGSEVPNRLCGPGAVDMKAGLATILALLDRFHQAGHPGRIRAVLTADEEHASRGLRALIPNLRGSDVAILLESTGLRLCLGHPGSVLVIARMSGALDRHRLATRLQRWSRIAQVRLVTDVRPSSLNFRAEVPQSACAQVVTGQLTAIIGQFAEIEYVHARDGFDGRAARDFGLIETFTAAAATQGLDLRASTVGGWTEAAMLEAAGIPTAIFGPGGHGAHTQDEWVDRHQVLICFETLAALLVPLLTGSAAPSAAAPNPSASRPGGRPR